MAAWNENLWAALYDVFNYGSAERVVYASPDEWMRIWRDTGNTMEEASAMVPGVIVTAIGTLRLGKLLPRGAQTRVYDRDRNLAHGYGYGWRSRWLWIRDRYIGTPLNW